MQRCASQLSECLSSSLKSKEADIKGLRSKYFQYHKTKHNKEIYWVCTVIDFSEFQPNILSTKAKLFDPERQREIIYKVDAIVRDDRLIIFRQQDQFKQEDLGICIYPNYIRSKRNAKFGIVLHQNWNDIDSINPTIISDHKIHEGTDSIDGHKLDKDEGTKLDDMWTRSINTKILNIDGLIGSERDATMTVRNPKNLMEDEQT